MEEKLQFCRVCGLRFRPQELSNRGICSLCGRRLLMEALSQMRAKSGKIYERWRAHYIAAMDGVLDKLRKEL